MFSSQPDSAPQNDLQSVRSDNTASQTPLMETCSVIGLLLGIVVRLVLYLSNRSLWFDEVALALNLQERSYGELLGALSYNQAAPPLFLWIEKFALEALGDNEYSLRLFPLLGGLLSLFLFYRFTRTYALGWARPIAILLFSIISYIAYFSSEVKPYSWDIALGLLLFMAISSIATLRPSPQRLLGIGLFGAFSIWLSFPSVLVMASVEATNLIKLKLWQASKADWGALLIRRVPLYAVWLSSLVGLYVMVVSKTLAETSLSASWADRYPDSGFDLLWMLDVLGKFFYRPLGFVSPADGLAMVVMVVGLVYLWRNRGWHLAYLGAPFVVTILMSYLHQYPFQDRLILFLVPYGLVILAEGCALLLRRWRQRPRAVSVLGVALTVALLVLPFRYALLRVVDPSLAHFDHVRPAIAHIHKNWQPGDKLFVFRWTKFQFQYYRNHFDFPLEDVLEGQIEDFGLYDLKDDDIERLTEEITMLEAGPLKDQSRMWFLMARKKEPAEKALMESLNQFGESLEITHYPTAVVKLMDLSEPP